MVMSFSDRRLFIPISIGNHYYTNKILKRIIREITSLSSESVFFICDKLRYLTYKIRNIDEDERIKSKVKTEVHQFKQRLKNCGIENNKNNKVKTWSFLYESNDYVRILNALNIIVNSDADIRTYLYHHSVSLMKAFFNGPSDKYDNLLQKQYIVEETALSIFMTEIYGTNIEIYRRMDEGLIVYLYKNKLAKIKDIILGKTPKRIFVSLENIL